MRQPLPKPDIGNPRHLLAFGLGAGCSPRAPGTAGTLIGIAVFLPLSRLELPAYLLATALIFALGVWICGRTAEDLRVHDHPGIVWDEIAGVLVALTAVPLHWGWLLAGFLLFRLFDIWKPWPIGWLDRRIGGGLGIMLDDLIAGLFTLAILQLARTFVLA